MPRVTVGTGMFPRPATTPETPLRRAAVPDLVAVAGVMMMLRATDALVMRIVMARRSDPLFQLDDEEALLLLRLPIAGVVRLLRTVLR